MKATMYEYLTSEPSLVAFAPKARWYRAGAVVDNPVKPFVVMRWLAPVPGAGKGTFLNQLRIDAHDTRGSYARIDAFQALLPPLLSAVTQLVGSDGRISQCDFLGLGGDNEDDTYGTNFSFTSWQVIGVRT